jgi:hypothetical protein
LKATRKYEAQIAGVINQSLGLNELVERQKVAGKVWGDI